MTQSTALDSEAIDTDVLVVGAGPCGITMANLLGVYGTRAMVIDRDTDILDFPRAVGIDDESLRTYQAVGLIDEVLRDIVQNTPIRYYSSSGRCFAHVKPSAQPFGWPRRNNFLQPLFEATLREGAKRFDQIELRFGHALESMEQRPDSVVAGLRAPGGETVTVRAKYLVGADGGKSTVRQLSGLQLTGRTAPVKWLVVDVSDDQLDAPYSAVYCHPTRPVLMVPLPYRYRRFEFKLQADEDEAIMTDPARVLELVASRYGSTPLPTINRARVYWHHSRIAERFQSGRVFLAGDAAHLQPPFFGQGMNSGIRDATNLAWKLAAVVARRADPRVLSTYDTERRAHAREMVAFATRIGQMYTPRNRATERLRDATFRALQLIPGGKEYILQMKYKPMPRYTEGIVVGSSDGPRHEALGRMFMQPMVEQGGRRQKFDEVLGPWFAVVGLSVDPSPYLSAGTRQWCDALGARLVRVDASRSQVAAPGPGVVAVEDVDGGFRDWRLARPTDEIIVLRPDRYVAAVCDRHQLEMTLRQLRRTIDGSSST